MAEEVSMFFLKIHQAPLETAPVVTILVLALILLAAVFLRRRSKEVSGEIRRDGNVG